jgi:hypothetical protein
MSTVSAPARIPSAANSLDHHPVGLQAGEEARDQSVGLRDSQRGAEARLELFGGELAGLEPAQQRQRRGVVAKELPHRVRREALRIANRATAGQMLVVSTPPKSTVRAR